MIGQVLAHYEILEKLGAGGMGEVYRARDRKLERDVALKVLREANVHDPERRRRFEREAKAVATLKHPNIVTIYAVEEAEGLPFLTMELVEGKTLSQIIPKNGFALERFFEIAIPLADAVAGAHASSITHRDLKPANVMFDAAGRVKVLDFGLAKLLQPVTRADDATVASDSATQEGRILGTVSYMSPEQAQGQPVDHRSDIFSLGIILYEMATGHRPFKGDTSIATISSIIKDTPPSVNDTRQQLPRHLGRIVNRCLAKEPNRRYQSALDLRNDLQELEQEVHSGELLTTGSSAVAVAPARRAAPRRLAAVAAAAATAVLLVAAGWFLFTRVFERGVEPGPAASDPNALAVMYFENLTDAADEDRMGRTAASLLTPALSSSGQLQMVSEQRLYDVLKKLKKQDVVTIDRSVASEVAREAGVERVILGQVSQAGSRLALTSQIVELESGRVIASQRAEGEGEEALFGLVDEIAQQIVEDLQVGAGDAVNPVPVANVTTRSVAAYRHYQDGIAAYREHRFGDAADHFDAAVAIDPGFAMAHFYRSRPFYPWGNENENRAIVNALHFSEQATPVQRGLIEAAYAWRIDEDPQAAIARLDRLRAEFPEEAQAPYLKGRILMYSMYDHEAAVTAFEESLALNPDDTYTLNSLAYAYARSGRHDAALRRIREYVAREPENPNAWDSLGEINWLGGDLEAAAAAFEQALALQPGFFSLRSLAYLKAMRGDLEGSLADFATYREDDGLTALSLSSLVHAAMGNWTAAVNDAGGAIDYSILDGDDEGAAGLVFYAADLALQGGRPEEAERWYAKSPRDLEPDWSWARIMRSLYRLHRALSRGDRESARATLEEWPEEPPGDDPDDLYVRWAGHLLTYLRGELDLAEGRVEEAVARFRRTLPFRATALYPNGGNLFLLNLPRLRDGLARAYVQQGKPAEAIEEYERLLHPDRGDYQFEIVQPIYHYRVGRLHEEQGNASEAARHYERFLERWKRADPGNEEIKDAAQRLAELRR